MTGKRRATLLLVIAFAAACGGGEAADRAADATSTSTSVASTTTTFESTVPAELRGRWETELPPPDSLAVMLTIGDRFYQLRRSGASIAAIGSLEAEGDRITFLKHGVCEGTGTYRWSLTDGNLQLTSVAPDECPSRAEVLNGRTYTPEA